MDERRDLLGEDRERLALQHPLAGALAFARFGEQSEGTLIEALEPS